METVDIIIESALYFYNDLKQDNNARYRSWEHCYANFCKARNNQDFDYDYLSLQLAFYLASWGMYRGSSFLLQKDYKVHISVVKKLLDKKFDPLVGIQCSELRDKSNQKLLEEITTYIVDYYDSIRRKVKDPGVKNQLSDTLVTKILMGTLGCVPAYDRYFMAGIKAKKVTTGNYNISSVLKLVDFYELNADKLESVRKTMEVYGMPYPQMKLLDMGFWQVGYDLDIKKTRR